MFLLLKTPSHTSVAFAGSLSNDRLIAITTSYRALVAVVERGGLTRSSDNPGDIANMDSIMMKPQKTQCIKHILEFYIGNGEGVSTARSILEYPIQVVQINVK